MRQPVVAQFRGCVAKRDDFRVGGGIAVGTRAVPGNGDELVIADDARADGHLTIRLCLASSGKSLPHPVLIKISLRGSRHSDLLPSNNASNNERPL